MHLSFTPTTSTVQYATSVLNNPEIELSDKQKATIERVIQKQTAKSETYTQSAAARSLASNPYNPYYGVSAPTNPYNYSAQDGQNSSVFSSPHTYKAIQTVSTKLNNPQSLAMQKFQLLRSQL